MLWLREGTRHTGGKSRTNPRVSGGKKAETPRWTHTCAWDGHELDGADYVQVSAHERVCRLHYPQFQKWLHETSKTMYRADDEGEA